ncbi:MAG: N-acetylmuramoyl-L-alanine amidase [Bacillota bacterium]
MGGAGGGRFGKARRLGAAAVVLLALASLGAARPSVAAAAGGDASSLVWIDGKPAGAADGQALMFNGTLMIPARLFEALGATIQWDPSSKTALLRRDTASIRVQVGSRQATVGKERRALPEPPELVEGRLAVPLRAVAEALGIRVEWDGESGRVNLATRPRAAEKPAPAKAAAPAEAPPHPQASPNAAPPARPTEETAAEKDRLQATGQVAGQPGERGPYTPSPRPQPPDLTPARKDPVERVLALLPSAGAPADAGPRVFDVSASVQVAREAARAVSPAVSADEPVLPATGDRGSAPESADSAGVPVAIPVRQVTSQPQPVAFSAGETALGPQPAPSEAKVAASLPPATKPAATEPPTVSPGEVTGVTVRRQGGRARIDILSEGPVRLRDSPKVLADPPRLVMDLEQARLAAPGSEYPMSGALVKGVRLAQYEPNVVRVAIDLAAAVGFQVSTDPQDGHVSVLLNHAVSGVYWLWSPEGRAQLWAEMSGLAPVRTATLTDPLRLVIDIQQSTLAGAAGEWEVSQGPVRRFRMSQFQPDVVRAVLELERPIQLNVTTSLDLTRQLLDAGTSGPVQPPGDMDLVLDVYSRITDVAVRPLGPRGASVVVESTGPIQPRAFYLRNPDRLVLDIPGAVVDRRLDPEALKERPGVGPALSVRVGQYLPRSARVVVELKQPVGYQIFSADERETMVVALGDRPLTGRTVAIDPGHGGFDPGAIGVSGTPEKVYNLDIATRLARLLESVGVEVTMTRRSDVYVSLDERVDIASRARASVFVSVHNNASTSASVVGTEVFYSVNNPASQRLAELLYDSLLDKLGTTGRGIRMRRDLRVLRLAEMPAALVEVSFVDHPDDENRLQNPAFRQKAAEAMFAAIVSFLSQVGNDTVETVSVRAAR